MGCRNRKGVSLIEIMVSVAVMVVGMIGILSVILHTSRYNAVNRENLAARRSAEKMFESMLSFHWKDIFKHYTANANDAYTSAASVSAVAHGPDFEVETNGAGRQVLTPLKTDADGKCGRIFFPTDASGKDLVETGTGAFMGMGQDLDLNGNGLIDGTDVSKEYKLLPVKLVIEWHGVDGPRSMTFRHLFLER